MIEFNVVSGDISDLLQQIPDGPARERTLQTTLDQGRFVVQRGIMDAMPVRTGFSRRNTDTDIGDLVAHVVVRGGAAFADAGTAPHMIYPSGHLLRFMEDGGANPAARLTGQARMGSEAAYIFAYAVHHPGQAAQNFIQTGVDESLDEFRSVMESALQGMIDGQ